ncbi:protealysin inhibitor emfourin [Kushneria phosphatilytica]|uniref:Uncharacterized protein n=1 Tax=Kushneria phosphatilytica TaxID=657387 RepID=A0A1S1NUD7_9GAMM|nr:protealysin inhibitor emfourin [Kushneria phosphatilytica]OHV09979.1 hypothetical protein BH688_10205 [Kushneria phosphatilytica]QEL11659.1 hypothetical protein FY550_11280 [Kushneria phosphatilytica]
MSRFADLDEHASIRLAREGGVVAAPGLSRPRQIDFQGCSSAERQRICAILDEADRCLPLGEPPGRGDQRFYRVLIWRGLQRTAEDDDAPRDELKVPESHAPQALVTLWRDGPENS